MRLASIEQTAGYTADSLCLWKAIGRGVFLARGDIKPTGVLICLNCLIHKK